MGNLKILNISRRLEDILRKFFRESKLLSFLVEFEALQSQEFKTNAHCLHKNQMCAPAHTYIHTHKRTHSHTCAYTCMLQYTHKPQAHLKSRVYTSCLIISLPIDNYSYLIKTSISIFKKLKESQKRNPNRFKATHDSVAVQLQITNHLVQGCILIFHTPGSQYSPPSFVDPGF